MRTYEGAQTATLTNEQLLRRSVLSCMLWESTFYESGTSIADRIKSLAGQVEPTLVASLAIEARGKFKLRSVPMLLARELARTAPKLVRQTLSQVIQRPDEMVKFMELYWKDGKTPIAKQVKLGLADALKKFDAYQLQKWDRSGATIRLRDIMFLTHPKPENDAQAALWKSLADDEMVVADTWEVGLSKAHTNEDKRVVWQRLLSESKLGGLALLRNLRNFEQVGVDREMVSRAISNMRTERILPYRFVTARKYAHDSHALSLEQTMFRSLENHDKIGGRTILLVDVSGSMDWPLDQKNVRRTNYWSNEDDPTRTNRIDVANGLAILLRELCENVDVYTFSDSAVKVPSGFRGFRLADGIKYSQNHNGTRLGKSLRQVISQEGQFDRMVVFTDEQSHDNIDDIQMPGKGYLINVAPYKHALQYGENWQRIDGFSESVIDWLIQYERESGSHWQTLPNDLFKVVWN